MHTKLNQKQLTFYSSYLNAFDFEYVESLVASLYNFGFYLNEKGQLFYSKTFTPLALNYELVFIRHGETYGNCGQTTAYATVNHDWVQSNLKDPDKRVFQGNVDEEINQLTQLGIEQSINAAEKLEKFIKAKWTPDIVFYSPLTRAKETARPFIENNNLTRHSAALPESVEMSFGAWDNRRVCDFEHRHICHSFYRSQNVLVKKSGINGHGVFQHGECFAEVLIRARKLLLHLNSRCQKSKIILFSHSMFGAACTILLGKGLKVEGGDHIAFDGRRKDKSSYTIPNATPIILNFDLNV